MSIYMTDTADVLRAAGVTVIEVPGWKTRGTNYRGGQRALNGIVCHHTATKDYHPGDMPTLSWLVKGGANLPGPVSNTGQGRSGTWYMIAAGRANHAGPVYAEHRTTFGNGYSHGVEAENSGVSGPWPEVQYESYARGAAAMSVYYDIPYDAHKNVRPGKVDPSFDWEPFVEEVERHARILRAHGFAKGVLPDEPVSLTATEESASNWVTPEGDDPTYLSVGHLHPKVAEIQSWATGKWAWARAILDTYGADGKYGRNTRTLVATLQERLNAQAAREKWADWTPLDVDGKWGPATEAAARSKSGFRKPTPAPKPPKEAPVQIPAPPTGNVTPFTFGQALEQWVRTLGYTSNCGPSDALAGTCTPTRHKGHSSTSLHFARARGEDTWALDVGRNPATGETSSPYELGLLSSLGFLLSDLYPDLRGRIVLNRGTRDHHDHLHVQGRDLLADKDHFRPDMRGVPDGWLVYGHGSPALSGGDRADEVKALQRALGVEVDGSFRLDTWHALREAQARHGITVDGIAGPATAKVVTR